MATVTASPEAVGIRDRSGSAWQVARWLVLGLYAVTLVLTALTGFRVESFSALQAGLERGEVAQVRVAGALAEPQGEWTGVTTVRLEWRDGWHQSVAQVRQASSVEELGSQAFDPGSEDYIIGDVSEALRQFSPDVEISRTQWPDGIFSKVAGWEAHGIPAYAYGLLLISFLILVLNAPEPRLATRWAWVWLALSPAMVVAVPAFLLLGARGQIPGRRRLNGLVAFLLCAVFLSATN